MFSLNLISEISLLEKLNSGVVKLPSYHEDKKWIAIIGYP